MNSLQKTDIIAKYEVELDTIINTCKSLTVDNSTAESLASDQIKFLKKLNTGVDNERKAIVKPLNDKVSEFNAEIKKITSKAKEALDIITPKLMAYMEEKAELERQRIEEENRKAQEQIRIEAEKQQAEVMRVAEQTGEEDLVDQAVLIEEQAEVVCQQIDQQEIKAQVKSRGSNSTSFFRENWKADVINMKEFFEWILKTERFELIKVDQKSIDSLSKAYKKEFIENGIKFYCEKTLSSR